MSLKIKQISDFVSGVAAQPVGTATVAAIGVVQSDVDANQLAIEGSLSTEVARALAAEGVNAGAITTEASTRLTNDNTLSTNLSTEVARALAAEGVLSGNISAVDGRVTTLLAGSDSALDTFLEIKTFVDALSAEDVTTIAALSTSLSNDIAQAADIATNVSNISTNAGNITSGDAATLSDAKVYTDAAELAAVSAAGLASIAYSDSRDVVTLAAAATAGNLAYDAIGAAAQALVDAKIYADTAESDAISTAASNAATAYESRISGLETTIIADNEMLVEAFPGAGVVYNVAQPVQDNNAALVNAFVNGQRVEILTAVGNNIEFVPPGYSIVSTDDVVISYQAV